MKNKLTRMLSGLLCLAMLLSFVPVMPLQAAAAESSTDAESSTVAQSDADALAAGDNYISLSTGRILGQQDSSFSYAGILNRSSTHERHSLSAPTS
jgi:hypothetical protein